MITYSIEAFDQRYRTLLSDCDPEHIEQINAAAWNRMARMAHPLAQAIRDEDLREPLKKVDEVGWLGGNIEGKRVLCLAAGGGRHSALYAAAGAEVTVVDLSDEMLDLDRRVSRERRYPVRIFQSSMIAMPMLRDAEFDIVIQPVSTCYVIDILAVYREVARVLRPGGLYISQHKQPMNLQCSLQPTNGHYVVDHPAISRMHVQPTDRPSRLREPGTREFAHTLESILGGMCIAGFVIEDLREPQHGKNNEPAGSFGHRCAYIPPYLRVKARRKSNSASSAQLYLEPH